LEELPAAEKLLGIVQEPISNDMIKEEDIDSKEDEWKVLDSR